VTEQHPVALITGAGGALGRVLSADLAADGYDLALLGSSAERLAALSTDLGLPEERILSVVADLRDASSTAEAIGSVYERFGQVDALAHLVGGWTGGTSIAETDDEPFESMVAQHLWTTLNVVRVLTPRMVAAASGRIVAVSSPLASRPTAGMGAYAVGKAAMEALLATLAQELSGTGVTANVVRVRTIDADHARDHEPSQKNASWTTPREISAAIRYFFSDDARVVNGERLALHSGI
jgi:NAD(P)-dependent dehydrogenase (short-subunit alcohol dehydrogenase family)